MGSPTIGNAPRITPQARVDTSVDTGEVALPQNPDIASAELRGWIAGRAAERRAQSADPQAAAGPAATAAAGSPLQVVTSVRASLDTLEAKLKGMPASMRDALVDALANGKPVPAGIQKEAADLAAQTEQTIDQQMDTLSPEAQANVLQLLDVHKNYPMSEAVLQAGAPPDGAGTVPGALGQALAGINGDISTPAQLDAVLGAAAKDGLSPDALVDQLTQGQTPLAQALAPRLSIPTLGMLADKLDKNPATANQFMQRLDTLQALATQHAHQPPSVQGSRPLMSSNDMNALIASGRSPQSIAQALLSGQGDPPRGRMTLDALNALESNLVPSGPMTPAARNTFLQQINGLQTLQAGMPATAAAQPAIAGLPPNAAAPPVAARLPATGALPTNLARPGNGVLPQPLSGQNPRGAAATSATATMRAGFAPTGNRALDLANSVANMPLYSDAQQALLDQITDPKQRAMQELQMQQQQQALLATTLSNLANMRHEMLKTVANNLRA